MKAFNPVLITGATGFLGSHIVPVLENALDSKIITVSSKDYDLLDPARVKQMVDDTKPEAVIHLAAKVGGITANVKYPAGFFYENLIINTQVLDACYKAGVKKFLTFMGGCSYPATAPSPIPEDMMWEGFPQQESAPYSVAKKVILVQSESYRRQYGFNSVVLIPGNVYGEYDNFNEEEAHVIPALIRRFIEAKENNSPTATCYGSGQPTRDFVYAGDVAKIIPWFLLNYNSSEPINISSGARTSIKELAEITRDITGYRGKIAWDTSKPDGQMDKIFSVKRLHGLGLFCDTQIEHGLRTTVDWFVRARAEGKIRL